jgi:hypothetical protein
MSVVKFGVLFFLIASLSISFMAAPVLGLADIYWPGVHEGQYVKYGNFFSTGTASEYANNDWMKYEVTNVTSPTVLLLLTGQHKDGTNILGNGDFWLYDVTFIYSVNGTPSTYSPIIAGNLNKGDLVGTYVLSPLDAVNDTQTRSYLGVNRDVNLLFYTNTTGTTRNELTCVYDKISGMLLEVNGKSTNTQSSQDTANFGYSVIDTNIFGPNTPIYGLPPVMFYAVVGALAAAIGVSAVVIYRFKSKRRKGHRS